MTRTCSIDDGPPSNGCNSEVNTWVSTSTTLVVIVRMLVLWRAAHALPPEYRLEYGRLILVGVSSDCPMIYDNDWWQDVPDAAYLWAKACQGKCDLRGNIVTRSSA